MLDRLRPRRLQRSSRAARPARSMRRDGAFAFGAAALFLAGLLVPAALPQAASVVTVTAPAPVSATMGTSVAAPGAAMSGFPGQAVVRAVVTASSGLLVLPAPQTGVTVPLGYPALGVAWSSLAFEGTEDALNTALANLRWTPSVTGPATIAVDATLGGPAYDPASGHHYEVVSAAGLTWDDARLAAEAMSFNGLPGYLASVISQDEQDFVARTTAGPAWIGASDATTEGTWEWVTGPEAGTTFWDASCGVGLQGDCPGLGYSKWGAGEPNDVGGNEDVAQFNSPDGSGLWIDEPGDATSLPSAYLVEFGGTGETPTWEGHAQSQLTAITTPGAPEAVTASAGETSATVAWTAPSDDGGSPVIGYTVTGTPGGSCTVAVPETSCTVTDLIAGAAYQFQVTATSEAGDGPASAPTAAVTPWAPPPTTVPPTTTPPTTEPATSEPATSAPTEPATTVPPASPDTSGATATGTTSPADAGAGAGAGQAESAPVEPSIHIVFDVGVGAEVAGARVTVRGAALEPGSSTMFTVHSDPIVLGTVVADAQGSFSEDLLLPAGLEEGDHSIVGQGTSNGGAGVYRVTSFAVEGGKITRIGPRPATAPAEVVTEDEAPVSAEVVSSVADPTSSGGGSSKKKLVLAILLLAAGGAAFVVVRRRKAKPLVLAAPEEPAGGDSGRSTGRHHRSGAQPAAAHRPKQPVH